MIKEIIRRVLVFCVKRFGYSNYMASEVIDYLQKDLKYRRTIGYRNMYKAYNKGFTGMFHHKLENANIPMDRCLPDLRYLKMHPLNGRFSHWIDDKLTLKYLLAKYDVYLPKYYGMIDAGRFVPLMDYPPELPLGFTGVLTLLQQKTELALKRNTGALSVGFYHVTQRNGNYLVNGNPTLEKEFTLFLQSLDQYLVTEYIHAHPFLKRINEFAPNILRLITINIDGRRPNLIASYLRIGQKSTGYTELTASGGLFCGVDLNTGSLFAPSLFDGPKVLSSPVHPDTKVPIEGNLPNWRNLVDTVLDICRYVPNLRYMGFDIIITDRSFKIIEINSLSGVSYIQLFHPLLNTPEGKAFFRSLDL